MENSFKIIKLENGRVGIHNEDNRIGWIIELEKGDTRKVLLKWAKEQLPQTLKELNEGKEKVCPVCKITFRRKIEKRIYCSKECSHRVTTKEWKEKLRREKDGKD